MNLLKEFKEYIEKEKLFNSKNKLLVAVSGGVDSMVLAHLLHISGYQIMVAHVNFNLRGEESEQDEILVQTFCQENNISFNCKKFDTKSYIKENKLGVQEAARELRYHWFNELLLQKNLDYIVTAHHANDQAETILFNLARGTGLKGLKGINKKENNLVRPLLFTNKIELENFAMLHKIPFRTDLSNEKNDYTRNFIRHEIIPLLIEINPSFVKNIMQFSDRMSASFYYYQKEIESIKLCLYTPNKNSSKIDLKVLITYNYPEYLLFEIIQIYGFNFYQCKLIIQAYLLKKTGAIFYSKGKRAVINRNELLLSSKTSKKLTILLESVPFSISFEAIVFEFFICEYKSNFEFEKNTLYLNYSNIELPLLLRSCELGDKFKPLGMKGNKKISDFFIDNKTDRLAKENAFVLCNHKKEILALLPYQISDSYKINSDSKKVLIIKMSAI